LRGIAALSVVFAHYGILRNVLKDFYWQDAAVDLFFCLSGFTLCIAYKAGSGHGLSFWRYLGARIARIYPLFMISTAGVILFSSDPEALGGPTIRDLVQQILLINAWPFFGTGIHWNFPAWSVSVEFFCYLFVFPPAFHASSWVLRVDWRARAALGVALMAVSALLLLRYWNGGFLILGFTHWPGTAFPPFAYFVPLIRGILGMLAGWLTYFSYLTRDRFWRLATRWADLVALLAVAILVCGGLGGLPNKWMLLVFPALILGFSSDASLSSRLVASRPVHYLGTISYSIYLLHIPWLMVLWPANGLTAKNPPHHHPASFFLLLAGLIVVAAFSYRFVEMPLRKLVRRAFEANRPADRLTPALRWALPIVLLGFALLQAQWAGLLGPPPNPPVAVGEDVARPPTFQRVAGEGWSEPEDWGTWSLGRRSVLEIPLAADATANLRLSVKGKFFVSEKHPRVVVHISANGVALETVEGTIVKSEIDQLLDLPPDVFAATPRRLEIAIAIDDPASPLALGLSSDSREIGFGLKSMKLVDGTGLP